MLKFVSIEQVMTSLESRLLLDCRSCEEFDRCHVVASHNIQLPQLMMRRLKSNKLSIRTIASQSRHNFAAKSATKRVVVFDHESETHDSNSLMMLLYNRMLNEKYDVTILQGGFSRFYVTCPHLTTGSGDYDIDSDDSNRGRCSPLTPSHIPPVLGLGALRIAAQDDYDVTNARRIDGFNSEGESDDPNSAGSALWSPIRKMGPQPAEILPGLFLGGANDATSRDVLLRHNISYILNVTPNLPNVFEEEENFKYKQIPIVDHWNQNLSQFFPEAIAFIDEARSGGFGVLVHCLAGISRSATLTVAYLMQTRRWSLNRAYDFVKRCKSDVSPNFNFMGQLLDFEKQLGLAEPQTPAAPLTSSTTCPTLFFTTPPTPPASNNSFMFSTSIA